MFKKPIFLYLLLHCCSFGVAVIYSVNESEYQKMPPLYAMDDYSACMLDPGGTYCVADFDLVSTEESDLLDFIKEYSAHTTKHFNHTQIHRGVCLSTCKENTTATLESSLEGCINKTIWNKYRLEATLSKLHYCKRKEDKFRLDVSDAVVLIVYFIITLLNVIGTIYDYVRCRDQTKTGNPYLLSLSIRRNWRRLTALSGSGPDDRFERLKLFNGLRAMTMVCVIFSHVAFTLSFSYVANPLYIEKAYDDPSKQILFNGSLVTHTFFVMSSFLLAYNLQIYSEKHEITWIQIPKGIFLRWIRLTPPYALMIATLGTLMRHMGDGPLWPLVVVSESDMCRQYWWSNIFYFNNYIFKDNLCFPQAWYLAADTQLFCLGLIILVAVRTPRGRKIALSLMFLVSLIITASQTYLQDLDAVVIQTPESYRNIYKNNDTFQLIYIRGHTNLSTYTLGLAGGLLTYHWQTRNKNFNRYKKYRWFLWLEFPLAVALILSGGIFYMDETTPSKILTVIYATTYKPLFQAMVVIFIIGCIFKIESLYRCITEWRGFTWAGRVSYSVFLVHTLFQRGLVGKEMSPVYISDYYVVIFLCASLFLSFACGAALWLLVEAPVAGLTKVLLTPSVKRERKENL